MSVVFNSMLVGWWMLTSQAIGQHVSLIAYMTFIPVLSLALMVPSIGGLGVREAMVPSLFAAADVASETAVAI